MHELGRLLAVFAALQLVAACDNRDHTAPVAQTAPVTESSAARALPSASATALHRAAVSPSATAAQLTRVTDPGLVCMVNNQYMGKPQIPTTVEGKTYYGCCAMCKGRLETDPATRSAIDPISQRPVDKATAVLAQSASGKMFYFENEQNLASYLPTGAD